MLDVYDRISLRKLEYESASLVICGGLSLLVFRVWGQVRSPHMGESASVNIMPGGVCPSTALRADVSASSLCVTPVWDFTLPICVLSPMLSLVCMMSPASYRRIL